MAEIKANTLDSQVPHYACNYKDFIPAKTVIKMCYARLTATAVNS